MKVNLIDQGNDNLDLNLYITYLRGTLLVQLTF